MKLEEQALQFRSEIARLQDQVRKAEARNEAAKAADKTEMVTSLQKPHIVLVYGVTPSCPKQSCRSKTSRQGSSRKQLMASDTI